MPRFEPDPSPPPPRPIAESYWIVPGRLLVGAHPGSRSRAQAMDRLRRCLDAGITCFIDLTEPGETPGYEALLPVDGATGRRVQYLREPIVDHGVPEKRATMAQILARVDEALAAGHSVYIHCRAGIGRSAMVAGCWLAERHGDGDRALSDLAVAWQQSDQSKFWHAVPETNAQAGYVLEWPHKGRVASARARMRRGQGLPPTKDAARPEVAGKPRAAPLTLEARMRGAWLGLALGDALAQAIATQGDAAARGGSPIAWTQHTSLALCVAESLLALGRYDARDQIERFMRWQREGYCAADGPPAAEEVSPDVARALAAYRWRGQPRAGSHDPRDVSPTSLPRVLAAASFAWSDATVAAALAAECARSTHQSPPILDACRQYASRLVAALRGDAPETWLGDPESRPVAGGAAQAIDQARRIVRASRSFEAAIVAAVRTSRDAAAPHGALVGTLFGLRHGDAGLPATLLARLGDLSLLHAAASRLLTAGTPSPTQAEGSQ